MPAQVTRRTTSDILFYNDQFYILATAAKTEDNARVIKQGETFAIVDRSGDIQSVGLSQHGVFHAGTRYLSRFVIGLSHEHPVHLSSTVHEESALISIDLMNAEVLLNGDAAIPSGSIHLLRTMFLWQSVCYQRLTFTNFGVVPITLPVQLEYDADFVDIFEIRGTKAKQRGTIHRKLGPSEALIGYQGADGLFRQTRIEFLATPYVLSDQGAEMVARLQPGETLTWDFRIAFEHGDRRPVKRTYDDALAMAEEDARHKTSGNVRVESSHEGLNRLLHRSVADLHLMMTETDHGPYPYAGVPWYSCPFGRDGIITSLETLWFNPGVARGTLQYLAATQATREEPARDAEPGKILHESRKGEMANLGEIPFGRYYGSIDATPLFIFLAGCYVRQTRDLEFIRALWPNIEAALRWIDEYGDRDKDGFVEYEKRTPNGLTNQGWKDSGDSIMHADGVLAEPPIALCEVQAYVYAAWLVTATMLDALERPDEAETYRRRAQDLKRRFEAAFWLEDLGTYALALDGRKRPCRVRSSNAGHTLFTGIASPERAARLVQGLMAPDMYSDWGVRTLSSKDVRYNPMSYHNGSVWPHDNALIALGLALYGYKPEACRILTGLLDASSFLEFNRLPELFSGFSRRPGQGPTRYPVACSPQAWAVAAPFMILGACLGMELADGKNLTFSHPHLPDFVHRVSIAGLQGSQGEVDLQFIRHQDDVGVTVLRKDGELEIFIVK